MTSSFLFARCIVVALGLTWSLLGSTHYGYASGKAMGDMLQDEDTTEEHRVYNVAIVLWDGIELLDFAGPGEVFAATRNEHGACFKVFTVEGTNVALNSHGTTLRSSGDFDGEPHRLEYLNDGRYGNDFSWISNNKGNSWVELRFPRPETIQRFVWSRDRDGEFTDRLATDYSIEVLSDDGQWQTVANAADRHSLERAGERSQVVPSHLLSQVEREQSNALRARRNKLKKQLSVLTGAWSGFGRMTQKPLIYGGVFRRAEPTHLLFRGDPEQPRDEVAPAVIRSLGDLSLSKDTPEQQRREALADWIASPENPLTSRVLVNRIWQGHFGVGLVETSSDFGRSGSIPSHPQLLDWLAREFQRNAWSIKHLHRQIVLSATYRQASDINPIAKSMDADSRLLWRFPSRRLESETIRDSMLAISGRLNGERGGPGFDLFKSRGGLNGFPPIESFNHAGRRRMIYAHRIRMERDIVFGAFDCPDAGQTAAIRRQSTTPIQALNLFNSQFTLDESAAFAARIRRDVSLPTIAQVRHAYWLSLGRLPTSEELSEVLPIVDRYGLEALCRVIYNTNEFLFIP